MMTKLPLPDRPHNNEEEHDRWMRECPCDVCQHLAPFDFGCRKMIGPNLMDVMENDPELLAFLNGGY
jgi:hypothetical protein